jgi:predicted dienelactone hydrolase
MRFAEDALAVQDALAMRPCLGFGHSLGGAALLLAGAAAAADMRVCCCY